MGQRYLSLSKKKNFFDSRTDIQIVLNTTENINIQALKKIGQLLNKSELIKKHDILDSTIVKIIYKFCNVSLRLEKVHLRTPPQLPLLPQSQSSYSLQTFHKPVNPLVYNNTPIVFQILLENAYFPTCIF